MTDYQEYMNTLLEQIQDRRARRLVGQEIQNHIEEQKDAYIADGMSGEEALKEAVRQMGDPAETGTRMNRLHRPRFPGKLLLSAGALTIAGILVQLLIYYGIQDSGDAAASVNLPVKTILYNLSGFAVMLLILRADYSFFGKYAYLLYGAYSAVTVLTAVYFNLRGFSTSLDVYTAFFVTAFFPLFYAGILYRNRSRGLRGMFFCLFLLAAALLLSAFLLGNGLSRIFETAVICVLLLFTACAKGIFGPARKRVLTAFAGTIGVSGAAGIFWMLTGSETFIKLRLRMFLFPQTAGGSKDCLGAELKELLRSAPVIGDGSIPKLPVSGLALSSDYLAAVIFQSLGVLAGIAVVAALLLFLIYTLLLSVRQTNRLGMLLGCCASVSLLVRTVLFLLGNFGLLWNYSTAVPFLAYGLRSTVINAVFVGVLLCVFRNSAILAEPGGDKTETADGSVIRRVGSYQIEIRRVDRRKRTL